MPTGGAKDERQAVALVPDSSHSIEGLHVGEVGSHTLVQAVGETSLIWRAQVLTFCFAFNQLDCGCFPVHSVWKEHVNRSQYTAFV